MHIGFHERVWDFFLGRLRGSAFDSMFIKTNEVESEILIIPLLRTYYPFFLSLYFAALPVPEFTFAASVFN